MRMPVERHENDAKEVGQKIRQRREELGLSQDDLADRMGISERNTISRHENGQGKNGMSICTFFQYAEALETSPQALFPDRFRMDPDDKRTASLNRIASKLSDESLRNLQALAEQMLQLETKAQQI